MSRTTRRALVIAAIASATALAVPAHSPADFHPVCTGVLTAYASVGLTANEDGTLTASGVVNCPGSRLRIDSLRLGEPQPPPGKAVGNKDPDRGVEAFCKGCVTPLSASKTTRKPREPGVYQVTMLFSAFGPEGKYPTVPRYGRWRWDGAGQPVPVCAPAGAVPAYVGPECA